MSEGRTMLGGRRYKIIREMVNEEWVNDVAAYEDGEDLCVTPKVFDALEDAEKRGVRSANDQVDAPSGARSAE